MNLPSIITLGEHGGDFELYYNEVYKVFLADLYNSKPTFQGRDVRLRIKGEKDGKDGNYHKLAHGGEGDDDNPVDLQRLERICWIKPIINACPCEDLKIWTQKRNRDNRILILHEAERFLIVLADRRRFVVLWTAYRLRKRKLVTLLKEYKEYIKTETAQT